MRPLPVVVLVEPVQPLDELGLPEVVLADDPASSLVLRPDSRTQAKHANELALQLADDPADPRDVPGGTLVMVGVDA